MNFYKSTIGKKAVMSVTGLGLTGFVFMHMIGNLKLFQGIDAVSGQYKLDVYGEFLRTVGYPIFSRGELLWIARLGLLLFAGLHIFSAFLVTQANREARPIAYTKEEFAVTSYAARTMWLGGIIIAVFVVYHLLHFTTGTVHFQGFEHGKVHHNVVSAFKIWYIVLVYVVAMAALGMHLYHGIWSAFQTLGINKKKWNRHLKTFAQVMGWVIFLGYVSVPVAILFGFE